MILRSVKHWERIIKDLGTCSTPYHLGIATVSLKQPGYLKQPRLHPAHRPSGSRLRSWQLYHHAPW